MTSSSPPTVLRLVGVCIAVSIVVFAACQHRIRVEVQQSRATHKPLRTAPPIEPVVWADVPKNTEIEVTGSLWFEDGSGMALYHDRMIVRTVNGKPAQGDIWVHIEGAQMPQNGDSVRFRGYLKSHSSLVVTHTLPAHRKRDESTP